MLEESSYDLQKHFLKMCGTGEEKMENARIAKQKLRQHLYLRFKTVIGDKICKFFGFSGQRNKTQPCISFSQYCNKINKFLNAPYEVFYI